MDAPTRYGRLLILHLAAALAWAVIVHGPWGPWRLHALAALAGIHLAGPFWSQLIARVQPLHRAFLVGPLALYAIDLGFLTFAWNHELWGELTIVYVAVLVGVGLGTLLYGAFVLSLVERWQRRRAG